MKRWDKVGRKVSGESQLKDNFLAKGRISEILEYKGFRTRVKLQRKNVVARFKGTLFLKAKD